MVLKTNSLPPDVLLIIRDKGTEHPFTGTYNHFEGAGTYLCRQCGIALFRSKMKFHSACGWPSFDEEIKNTVLHQLDQDGIRQEILCRRCHAHLGHVFHGEQLSAKNLRYCVNSVGLDFVPDSTVEDTEEALFAGGCFWGVEFLFNQLPGVLKTEVGYTGGHHPNPTYQEICEGHTGHFEAVRVLYDPKKIDFESVAKYFFEIHDFTQITGQGPDLGEQYLSVLFYYGPTQQKIGQNLIEQLHQKNHHVATRLLPVSVFWPAEEPHQNYYQKNGKKPYCHLYTKRF